MIYFGREATRRAERQWRRLSSLAGRFLQLVEGLPTLRAFGREAQGRREVEAANDGVRSATMRTLRIAFLSALSMDMIAGFGVGFVAMVLGLRLLWGQLGLQTAMAVLLVAPEIFIPLRRAGAEFHASTEGQAAADRVLEVLDTPAATPSGGPLPLGLVICGTRHLGARRRIRASGPARPVSRSRCTWRRARAWRSRGPRDRASRRCSPRSSGFVTPSAGTVAVGGQVRGADPDLAGPLLLAAPAAAPLQRDAGGEPATRRARGERRRTARRARRGRADRSHGGPARTGWRPRSATTG